jgi:hypothetical protein
VALDTGGDACVIGWTVSRDFPTANALQPAYGGGAGDAFVAKFTATGTALVYSTYLGGSGWEIGRGVAVDADGNAYVTGYTPSADFPTVDPVQAALAGVDR